MVLDTKSKKFSYLPFVKFLCIFLSAVMFFICSSGVFQFIQTVGFCYDDIYVDEIIDLCVNGKPDFFESAAPTHNIFSKIYSANELLGDTPDEYLVKLQKQKDSFVKNVVNEYALDKSDIIRKELVYVAENYNSYDGIGGVYNENGYNQAIDQSIPEVPADEQRYPVDPYASKTVQMVQKILNYASGTEFLKYSALVRKEAFSEYGFEFNGNNMHFNLYNYEYQLEDVQKKAEAEYNSYIEQEYAAAKYEYHRVRKEVSSLINIIYYVKNGDEVYTNMTDPQEELASIKTHKKYILKQNGAVDDQIFGSDYERVYDLNNALKNCETAAIYINDNLVQGDELWDLYSSYNKFPGRYDFFAIAIILSFFLMIVLSAAAIASSGHKYGKGGITTAFIDKLPVDLHFALSAGSVAGIIVLQIISIESVDFYSHYLPEICGAVLSVCFLILLEFIISVVRFKKSGASVIKHCIIIRILLFIIKLITKAIKKVVNFFKKPIYSYKMGYLKVKFLILAILFILFNAVMLFLGYIHLLDGWEGLGVIIFIITALADIGVMFFVAKYMKFLDKVIVAATQRKSADFGFERVPESLNTLNEALKITKDEMSKAVENAIKNERTKTELITNVSHDLKTPLTSMISYVDLLKKCDINDEDAIKYIDVLSDKSQNLKKLIENLIEASKTSSGNIKINKAYLNLKELVAQATAEFLSDFESRELDLKFKEDSEDIRIFADGQHTYRVLENLLSNAKKYSAKGTRVYASIRREGKYGVFELKNISKDPLNISADELTERFVRGDASRGTEEGNGLGLSIAKQLCSLQGGELKLTIDGDLFKATVYLPIN